MSIRLSKVFARSSDVRAIEGAETVRAISLQSSFDRSHLWLWTYTALFTSLLAFFIFTITTVVLETSSAKRDYQKLLKSLQMEAIYHRDQIEIPWLSIERTTTQGIRFSLPADLLAGESLFASASAQLNPNYIPYLQKILALMNEMKVEQFKQRYQKLIGRIEKQGYQLKLIIQIEGHTDANPIAPTARFRNNVELSSFRAYAMMEWLRIRTGLPRSQFSIAGYGSFKPIADNPTAPQNRRIEIYLKPLLLKPAKSGESADLIAAQDFS